MQLHVGNPANGIDVVVDIDNNASDRTIREVAKDALMTLRAASEACKEAAIETETAEEKRIRELMAEEQEVHLRQREQQVKQARKMLEG